MGAGSMGGMTGAAAGEVPLRDPLRGAPFAATSSVVVARLVARSGVAVPCGWFSDLSTADR
ncbi:hypothetical protein SAMN05216188_11950 [Lentzea xinjiangensis]|uniref:Uncharacterized protein n=1 Tax=Lentzea xinjiangensis TaxID=402600 RepID=A0A1H9TT15_9PSEU|nr:hypothetical protein [Lentzea xinjiangensis]SES00239.1 hypothetical protein SAMN05216188_11950 [Lentzea xinjiangensis]